MNENMKDVMRQKLLGIKEIALNNLDNAEGLDEIEQLRVRFLGKKGELTAVLRDMGKLIAEERPVIGQVANEIRDELEDAISSVKGRLNEELKKSKMAKEKIDITMTSEKLKLGHRQDRKSVV